MNFPSLPTTAPDVVLKVIAGVAALALAAALAFLVFVQPKMAKQDAADARAGQVTAEAQAEAAADTIEIVRDTKDELNTIDKQTEENSNDITNAPGADDQIDPALHDAGVRSLCLRNGNQDRPACKSVLHGHGFRIGAEGGR